MRKPTSSLEALPDFAGHLLDLVETHHHRLLLQFLYVDRIDGTEQIIPGLIIQITFSQEMSVSTEILIGIVWLMIVIPIHYFQLIIIVLVLEEI